MTEAGKKTLPSILTNRRTLTGLIFLLGLLMRLLAWMIAPVLKPDTVFYLQQAKEWADSGTLAYDQPPLLLWILKCMYQAGLNAVFWGILLNILFSMLFLWTLLKCSELLFPGKLEALAILFFAAIHPTLILLSNQIMRDIPYCACMGLFLLLFLVMFRKDLAASPADGCNAALQGGILAVACFFRHEAFTGILFFMLYQTVVVFLRRRWKNWAVRNLAMLTAFLLVFLMLGMLTGLDKNWKNICSSQYRETMGLLKP